MGKRTFNREVISTMLTGCLGVCRFTVGAAGAVGTLKQAAGNSISSITRDSAGNYTVQFNEPYPAALPFVTAEVHCANSSDPLVKLEMDANSYSNTDGNFQLRSKVETTDGVAATGLLTLETNANMTDGDYITIDDGFNTAVLYEYDKSGNGVTAGRVQVTVGGATTAAEVAARFALAIAANQPLLTVVDNADGTLSLTHTVVGTVGNETITENATHAGVLVAGMSGGVNPVGAAVELPVDADVQLFYVELRSEMMDR